MKIRIGTRGSELALWQAEYISGLIGKDKTEIVIIKTKGDQIQNVSFDKIEGKGFFTKEIEEALLDNRIDLAVHSLKDLPTEGVPGLTVAAIPEREDPSDMLLINKDAFSPSNSLLLRNGATVGTGSVRRLAQLMNVSPDIEVRPLRGNINTRVQKLRDGHYDAIVLAYAGIKRIGLDIQEFKGHVLPHETLVPSPAQGAIGLQARMDDRQTLRTVEPLNHHGTVLTVKAERSFLKHFGGGCHTPLGAIAYLNGEKISLTGIVASVDGSKVLRESIHGKDPEHLGAELSRILKDRGAEELL
jgi:hydroxymethylbilane synthase